MVTNDLSYRVAERLVEVFARKEEQLKRDHLDAMECRDCEDFLRSGIQALEFIESSERILLEAGQIRLANIDKPAVDAIQLLYTSWLRPCAFAEQWISQLESKGRIPGNRKDFKEAQTRARKAVARDAIVRSIDEPLFHPEEVIDFDDPDSSTILVSLPRLCSREYSAGWRV